ncbi:GNAT family N-acetyltransferase [uncultured Sphingomonas sp.]|uniref:GNAT family N-acetyltransferase n=1 Tax=uncultured Sphingomonas sp. TaxID=158754 RepID=UPI0025F3477A|nr:N-acetyltransferase [uncultured Sphingomonas sp.]
MTALVPLDAVAPDAVEALLDRAFPPGRQARTAYKVRGSVRPIASLCFAAVEGTRLIGSIQCWPVALTDDDGRAYPMVMVGPVAVEPEHQQGGIGRELLRHMLDAAAAQGLDRALMLIGDPEYYGRFFGFSAERTADWRLPGPVERHRLLARGPDVPALAGMLGPDTGQGQGLYLPGQHP